MELFDSRRKKILRKLSLLFPIFFLILVCCVFFFSINFTSKEALYKEQQTLQQALENGAIRSYALNGQYPESLEQLLQEYHITYDQTHFVVEYTPNGTNLLPHISVILLTDTQNHGRRADK